MSENWYFTKQQAEGSYKRSIKESRVPVQPGMPKDYLKKKIGGENYYYVGAYFSHINDKAKYGVYVARGKQRSS